MYSASQDPRKNRDPYWWVAPLVAYLLMGLIILTCTGILSGCSPRIYEKVITRQDTIRVVQRDSVHFYDRDSIFIREKGDTIYKYVERWRWRDRVRVDTFVRVRVDSVAVERIKEVEVEKPLTWWQNAKIRAFWWLAGAVLLLLVWTFRKQLLKLIAI